MHTPAKILIVDDERLILELLVETLNAVGYEAYGAYDGQEALERLKSEKFDLVIADVVMPVLNGISLLVQIQKEFPDLPVVIITGHAYEDVIKEVDRAGAAAFLAKPFRISKVEQIVESTLGKKKESIAVLVVDDDPIFLDFLGDSLKCRGYAPLKAHNAEEALAFARLYPVRFAIVDIGLPGRSGLELAQELKGVNPNFPVVLVTGQRLGELNKVAEQADLLLKKPIALEELYQAIESIHPTTLTGHRPEITL
jgi:DNA-binding NtrC family response regulator